MTRRSAYLVGRRASHRYLETLAFSLPDECLHSESVGGWVHRRRSAMVSNASTSRSVVLATRHGPGSWCWRRPPRAITSWPELGSTVTQRARGQRPQVPDLRKYWSG